MGRPNMMRNRFPVGLFAGLLVGTLSAVLLSGGYATPRAIAQARTQQPTATTQRFQISAWAHPAGTYSNTGVGSNAMHGAYVLDTQTGKVWQIKEGGKPEPIGGVE